MKKDTRYPYTYSCDYLRTFGGHDAGGVRLSRADASQIRQAIAVAIGMSDEELANKLADYYLANEQEVNEVGTRRIVSALKVRTSTEFA